MMKFIFMVGASVGCVWVAGNGFWMVGGVLTVCYMYLMLSGLSMLDWVNIGVGLSMDMFSFSLIILSLWVSILMLFSSNSVFKSGNFLFFYLFVLGLAAILVVTFLVNNLFAFYFFFEASLVPTLLIILGWGYQPERLQAGIYFLFYTLGASLPLLLVLTYNHQQEGGLDFLVGGLTGFGGSVGMVMFFFSLMAFMVKMPMFFIHLWLPKAHVEAPVAGSMILAGVLLKLGGYGIYRIFIYAGLGVGVYGGYLFGLSVLGMVYVGFMCIRLSDMKALVAYSSVAHMGMVICGLLSYYFWGFNGGLIMMISHGICSSGLFCVVNLFYERSGSRAFYINSGMITVVPLMSLLFFMLCVANMAAPPSLNLLAEIFLMGSMMKFDLLMLIGFPLGSYLGAVFTLFLFSYSQHGGYYEGSGGVSVNNFREYHLLLFHLFPLNVLVLKPEFFLGAL